MKSPTDLLLVPLLCLALLPGCSRTITGGYEDSPEGKSRLWVRTFGAYSRAFVHRTRKTVRVRLVEVLGDKNNWNEKLLFEKQYHFTCADVGLKTSLYPKSRRRGLLSNQGTLTCFLSSPPLIRITGRNVRASRSGPSRRPDGLSR
jgi:hypothetical protein